MESLKVVTLKRHNYCGRVRRPGDEYFVENKKHLKFLEAIKRARSVPPEPVKPVVLTGAYSRKDVRSKPADAVPERKDVDSKPKPRAQSKRTPARQVKDDATTNS